MHQILLFLHSAFRWLVLASLLLAIFRGFRGTFGKLSFSQKDDSVRHWTATISHIQMMVGILLYSQSPLVRYFFSGQGSQTGMGQPLFFGVIHVALMLAAIVMLTIGSAMAKRKTADRDKFRTMLIFFSIALLLILTAIPWPFSPLAQRPYFTPF
jgi:hypothetical protein